LSKYNFKKPRKQAGPSEQINAISISDSKGDHQKDDLQTKMTNIFLRLFDLEIKNK
jgi:hypothetical protein